jgi:regulator of nucleoside diphosphate kinase
MKSERYLSQQDATILSHLAQHLLRTGGPCAQHAEQLIAIIETSILLPVNATRNDYVALYSTVACRDVESNQHISICIVCPREVHDGLERVSILAPLALSLVGRIVGSFVDVTLPFVRPMYVEITGIEHSAPMRRPAAQI